MQYKIDTLIIKRMTSNGDYVNKRVIDLEKATPDTCVVKVEDYLEKGERIINVHFTCSIVHVYTKIDEQ